MKSLALPQEIEVWYILPALRKQLSIELSKLGVSQKNIAKILHITPPAVSQYLSNKRANLALNKKIIEEAKKSAKRILETSDSLTELYNLLKIARDEKLICKLHKKHCASNLKECDICFRGQ